MKKNLFLLLMMVWSCGVLFGQQTWVKTFGGSKEDFARSVAKTLDSGSVIAGYTCSNDGDMQQLSKGDCDVYVCKLDRYGEVEWFRTIGGSRGDLGMCITSTLDSGYLFTGYTESENVDFERILGSRDAYVVKLDKNGFIQWKRSIGGSGIDWGTSISVTPDGGAILTGYTQSNDGDFKNMNVGRSDIFVVKIDAIGEVLWFKTIGGHANDMGMSTAAASDNGVFVSGYTWSNSGDFKGMTKGSEDIFIMKFDSDGELQWKRVLGGANGESSYSVAATDDGGVILTGYSRSNDGDFKGMAAGETYIFVIKLDQHGRVQWKKSFGGSPTDDVGNSIAALSNGGYILAGEENEDVVVVKMNHTGETQWKKLIIGSRHDTGYSVIEAFDGGLIITGRTFSNDGDFNDMNKGDSDIFVIKLDSSGNLQPSGKKSKEK